MRGVWCNVGKKWLSRIEGGGDKVIQFGIHLGTAKTQHFAGMKDAVFDDQIRDQFNPRLKR